MAPRIRMWTCSPIHRHQYVPWRWKQYVPWKQWYLLSTKKQPA